jgi:hypothetical protein
MRILIFKTWFELRRVVSEKKFNQWCSSKTESAVNFIFFSFMCTRSFTRINTTALDKARRISLCLAHVLPLFIYYFVFYFFAPDVDVKDCIPGLVM